ncbi:MAG: hypothetical protein WA880_00130 [Ornithinimicrobium sp.]
MSLSEWHSGQVLAWTDRDGPGRPPKGPALALTSAVAVTLAVAHIGMLSADTLCPEHRGWVIGLAVAAIFASGFAVVGLVRGWASSALLTVLAAGCGVAIGMIDILHNPTRGTTIVVIFAVIAVCGAALSWWHVRLHRWERATVASLRPVDHSREVSLPTPSSASSDAGTAVAPTTASSAIADNTSPDPAPVSAEHAPARKVVKK